MLTYLDRILAAHREAASRDSRSVTKLVEEASRLPPTREFAGGILASLAGGDRVAVIAEVKRRSPSKGDLMADLDPGTLARAYEAGGAACLSVLTDEAFFGGSMLDLQVARDACSMPVLRKDFTVCEADVCDARLMGADCVLLIVAALDDAELVAFNALAGELGLDSLIEVHDEAELERALAVGANIVGVNQRDLTTFEVDTHRAVRMARQIPDGVIRVAESGIRGPEDAATLAEAGFDAVLVGESLVRHGDRATAVAALRGH